VCRAKGNSRMFIVSKPSDRVPLNVGGAAIWFIAFVVSCLGCGGETTSVDGKPPPSFTAPVTFIVTGIEPEILRVDLVINSRDMDPVFGSVDADTTDRVTLFIPPGDSINAFARAFEVDTVISYIGETYFSVQTRQPMEVVVPLKVKGSHAPTS